MIKKTISYVDYDGNQRNEDHWFNLNESELMEMEYSASGGMQKTIDSIIKAEDTKRLIEIFKDIILRSYGEKSLDGRQFIKVRNGVRLCEEFSQSAAYSALFMELATDDVAAKEFMNGIIPQGLAAKVIDADEKAISPVALTK